MGQPIRDEVIAELLQGYSGPDDLLGVGFFRRLKKRLLERARGAELTAHLGDEKGDPAGRGRELLPGRPFWQSRNGSFPAGYSVPIPMTGTRRVPSCVPASSACRHATGGRPTSR